ncbi:hypothetical protein IQ241_25045 [Romeria aff. gracilis LEGE 07310]|uniref:Uncharacterized protein n=1 Tax=Vasconcelosia minhoensis LEGE 07310 TaxID=915328 RepID=A0A8J7DSP8_9CYAN|nr:hypothetical protein [Romeria gracilis]MBE9080509.1 hypothetical protein [Romeria aff. gracilis LEGE 07310]
MTDLIVPAVLRFWLAFLIIFFLLGYSVPFSIVFGLIGGLSGGMVNAWWQLKGGAPPAPDAGRVADKIAAAKVDGAGSTRRASGRDRIPRRGWLRLPGWRPGREHERYLKRRQSR